MRRAGKTTRAIDEAIQALFTDGEIIVPANSSFNFEHLDKHYHGWVYTGHVATDPDYDKGRAQQDFAGRLFRRLESEHKGMYLYNQKGSFYVINVIFK